MMKLLHMKIIGYQNATEGVNLRIVFAIKVYKNELRREKKKVEKTVFKTKRFQRVCTVILHGGSQKLVRKSDTILGCSS